MNKKFKVNIPIFTFISLIPVISAQENILFNCTIVTALLVALSELTLFIRRNTISQKVKALYGVGLCIFALSNLFLLTFLKNMCNIFYIIWDAVIIMIYTFIFIPLVFDEK